MLRIPPLSPQEADQQMRVVDGLQTIRGRLEEQGADQKTLSYVDVFIKRAQTPGIESASVPSLSQLVKMLIRNKGAQDTTAIYNDLAKLEETMNNSSAEYQARKALEDAKPLPKTKKYYQDLKEKQKKQGA